MACVNADGTVTALAKAMLKAVQKPATLAEVAQTVGFPMYRVRSGMRELAEAGLVAEVDGCYQLTEAGVARVTEK